MGGASGPLPLSPLLTFHSAAVERAYLLFAYGIAVTNGTTARAVTATLLITAAVLLLRLIATASGNGSFSTLTALSTCAPVAVLGWLLYMLNMKSHYYARYICRGGHELATLGTSL